MRAGATARDLQARRRFASEVSRCVSVRAKPDLSETFKTLARLDRDTEAVRVGIGLPAAVPGLDGAVLGPWAVQSERVGFTSLGVIDRLVYDNLDPLVALAAAAARTGRIELLTTVLNVGYRRNPTVLAKQIASVDQLSTRRLTVGLALGGWPEDYAASGAPLSGRGATFAATLVAMRKVWRGKVSGSSGPMPALPEGHPRLLLGGLVAASFDRVAAHADGWVAPSFGMAALTSGTAAVHRAWKKAGRRGQPRIVVERYFSLGDAADEIADHYLREYYGSEYFPDVRADALTSPEQIRDELRRLDAAGCDDVVLFPCSAKLDQVALLSEAVPDSYKAAR